MGPYGPYPPSNPLSTVRNGALVIAWTLVGFLALEILDTALYVFHIGFFPYQLFSWLTICGKVVLLVGVVLMSRLPRAFGVQLAAWSAFAFTLISLLISLVNRISPGAMGYDGVQMAQWFVTTAAYGCFTPLVMVTASQTGIRWGAATNAVVASVVGIWRVGELYFILRSTDDDYYGRYAYLDPRTIVLETLLSMPAMGALAALFLELRALRDLPFQGPLPPPMAPYPGGFAPPPPMGGYGPPGPPPMGGYGPPPY